MRIIKKHHTLIAFLFLIHSHQLFSMSFFGKPSAKKDLPQTVKVQYLSELTKTVLDPDYKPLQPGTLVEVASQTCAFSGVPYYIVSDSGGDTKKHTVIVGQTWHMGLPTRYARHTFSYESGETQKTNGKESIGLTKINTPEATHIKTTSFALLLEPATAVVAFILGNSIKKFS